MPRGRVDIFVLRVLMLSQKDLCLREIVQEMQQLNLKRPPGKTAIYKRLNIMAVNKLVQFSFTEERIKLYRISQEGLEDISQLTNYLTNQLAGAESK
jgi:DNA-binding PadR family transcriptional regulator